MSLSETINKDYIEAYKAKNSEIVSVLRMLKTAIKNLQIELKGEPDDEQILQIIGKQVKQRRDSIKMFKNAGRLEMAQKEEREAVILQQYLPPTLSEQELSQAVSEIINELGASGMKDMGRVMGTLTSRYKDRVDGSVASGLVKSKLS